MSDPVTNVQIEDVLSSIRRLVSEEIGQQTPLHDHVKARKAKEDVKLILSPAQKIRQDAADQGDDLWKQTEEMKAQIGAPVWRHRDMSRMAQVETADPAEAVKADNQDRPNPPAAEQHDVLPSPVAPDAADVSPEYTPPESENINAVDVEPLKGALAGLKAARDIYDAEWENPEGEEDMTAGSGFASMPWQGAEDADDHADPQAGEAADRPVIAPLHATAASESEPSAPRPAAAAETAEDVPFKFRPGERLFERLSSKKMSPDSIPQAETIAPSADPKVVFKTSEQDRAEDAAAHVETRSAQPQPVQKDTAERADQADQGQDPVDLSDIFDEEMLRDMVKDIIRQELQGALGERITRNVRKLVRREIQRALSDIG